MSFQNSRSVKKTRKDHWCHHCLLKIPMGSSCGYYTGVWEGDFYAIRSHDECEKEYRRYNAGAICGDEWYPLEESESFKEWQIKIRTKYNLEDPNQGESNENER